MVEVGQDGQGGTPSVAGRVVVPAGMLGFAEAYQRVGLVVSVAVVAVQGERLPVRGDGVGVPAEMVVRETEAVRGRRLTGAVAEFLLQPERLLTVLQCRLVVA